MNIHLELSTRLQNQIHMELQAWYNYKALHTFFSRSDVGLKGYARYFKLCSDEELQHADGLIEHVQRRGGNVTLNPLQPPEIQMWNSGIEALKYAQELERNVANSLINIYKILSQYNDPLVENLIGDMLTEQSYAEQELGFLISNAERCGDNYGELYFDGYLNDYLNSKSGKK